MRVWMDGFQVRWCFKIVVETAAGAVFLLIIKPKPWVRRDGLSSDFHAGEPPTSLMRPHWACVVFFSLVFRTNVLSLFVITS